MWFAHPVADPDGRTFLHVGAANHTSRVFVDGEELATHVGGFGPYAVELTGRLEPGEQIVIGSGAVVGCGVGVAAGAGGAGEAVGAGAGTATGWGAVKAIFGE